MKINEIAQQQQQKINTPDEARIGALKQAKDRANDALKAERKRQKLQKAQKQIAQINLSRV